VGNRDEAVKFFNQAVQAHNDKTNPQHLQLSYQLFASACIQDPTWSDAFYQAGNNNSELNLWYTAIACWRKALQTDQSNPTDRAKIYTNLAYRLHSIGRVREAIECSNEAIKLDPKVEHAWTNLSLSYQMLDQPQKSLECAREAWRLSPDDPITEMSVAFAALFAREFEEAYVRFEARFPYKLRDYLQYPYAKWNGEPDKTVYLVADQGLGDTLSYARFLEAAAAKAKYIHARIQPELYRLFQHSFSHIRNINWIPGLSVGATGFPAADVWSTFVSLPYVLKLTSEQVRNAPDIAVPPWTMPLSWKAPDAKFHIGVAWRGSQLNDIDRHRNLPLHLLFELCRVKGIQLYSLQVGEYSKEMHDIGGAPVMRDLTPYIRDVCDTVALLRDLDLVVTCESALGHICAMAGKECWIPYSHMGRDYRIGLTGTDDDRIWTPRHRIFRQGEDLRWEPVFAEIVAALEERVHGQA